MAKFRVACHVITWGNLACEHTEPVFRQIAQAGYEGVEGLWFEGAEALVETAAAARAWGLHVVMAHARTPGQVIRYNAALGNRGCEIWEGTSRTWVRQEPRMPTAFPRWLGSLSR